MHAKSSERKKIKKNSCSTKDSKIKQKTVAAAKNSYLIHICGSKPQQKTEAQ